jgi:hypothetical protein
MNLIPLQKEMPEVIWNVYNKVKKVMSKLDSFDPKKDIVIGGGCLSNSYMNKPIRDIDVFVQYNEEDREIYKQLFLNAFGDEIEMITIDKGDSYSSFECPMLYRFTYEEMPVEIIFNLDINRVFDFDIRLRQFYLIDDQIMVSEKALEDIENKVLALSCPYTPIRTLVRMFQFKEEFGFSIEKESEDVIFSLLGKHPFQYDYFEKVIETRKSILPMAKWHLDSLLSPYKNNETVTFPAHPFPYHQQVEELFESVSQSGGIRRNMCGYGFGNIGKNYEKLKNYQPNERKVIEGKISINWFEHQESLRLLADQMKSFLSSERTEMLFESRNVYYRTEKPIDELFEKAKEYMEKLEASLKKRKEEMEILFTNSKQTLEERQQWFNNVHRIFDKSCSYYNPIDTVKLDDKEYRRIFDLLYEQLYKNESLDDFINTFLYGEEMNRSLFNDIINRFFSSEENGYLYHLFTGLFNRKLEINVDNIQKLNVFSLEDQIDNGYEIWNVIISHNNFQFLTKNIGNEVILKQTSKRPSWVNSFVFAMFKNELPNIQEKIEREKEQFVDDNNDSSPFELEFLPF